MAIVIAPNGKRYEVPDDQVEKVQQFILDRQRADPNATMFGTPPAPTGSTAPAEATAVGVGPPRRLETPEERQRRLVGERLGVLPVAGRVIGGTIGAGAGVPTGPGAGLMSTFGAMRGAAIGGAGGEALRQLIERAFYPDLAPQTPQDALSQIGASGVQGAIETGVGLPLTAGMRGAAKSLMGGALKPTERVVRSGQRTLQRQLGRPVNPVEVDLPAQAINAGVAPWRVAPWTQPGSRKFAEQMRPFADQLDAALDDMAAGGKTFTIQDVTRYMGELRKELSRLPSGADAQLRRFDRELKALIARYREPGKGGGKLGKLKRLTPKELNDLKRDWQAVAENLYTKESQRAAFDQAFARAAAAAARRSIEQAPGGDAVARANAELARMMPLMQTLERAEMGQAVGSGAQLPIIPSAAGLFFPQALRARGPIGSLALRAAQIAPALGQTPSAAAPLLGTEDWLIEAMRASAPPDR